MMRRETGRMLEEMMTANLMKSFNLHIHEESVNSMKDEIS
jgi:hypothetical protein